MGYGDFYPRTPFGRIVIIFCCIYGVTVVSLIIVTITNTLNLNGKENMAFITLEKLQIRSQMSDLSAKIIGCVGKLSTKKVNSSTEERMIYVKKLKKYKSDFM